MKHELKISRLTMVFVLCASAACPVLGASSVRSLGGAGTYSSASGAVTAKTTTAGNSAGGVTAARAGSMRVSSVSQTAAKTGAGDGVAVRAAGTPRLSIGKYLGSGTSLSGGSSIKNQAAGSNASSSSNSGTMAPDVAADLDALNKRIDGIDATVAGLYNKDELDDALSGKQDALTSKDEFVVVDGNDIYLDVDNLSDVLQDSLGGEVDLTPYAKTADVNSALGNKLDKDSVPTKLSQFENDTKYVTQTQLEQAQLDGKVDLSGYVTTEVLSGKADKTEIITLNTEIGKVNDVASGAATSAATAATTANTAKSAAESAAAIANTAKSAADTAAAKADAVETSLTSKADKTDVPTKVSQLENDEGYLKEHQSLDDYAKTADVNASLAGYVTQEQLDEAKLGGEVNLTAYAKTADVNTALNNKADKTAIPSKISQLENDEGYLKEHQSLDDYAKTADINETLADYATTEALDDKADKTALPTKVSQLENDEGYLKEHQSLDDYAKTADINETLADYATTEALDDKADKTAIPSKVSQLENDEGYLKEHQSLDGYVNTNGVDTGTNKVLVLYNGEQTWMEIAE